MQSSTVTENLTPNTYVRLIYKKTIISCSLLCTLTALNHAGWVMGALQQEAQPQQQHVRFPPPSDICYTILWMPLT